MALNESQIAAIETSITALRTNGEPLAPGLRSLFPDIVFVRCDAEDMDTAPYRSGTHYQLYLLDRSELCIRLTDQLESADGVIIAELD
ncbi:MAG: hypothetical protein GC139_08245 [Sideroxydans sp.]|nr:hypothetical protein [Sideroxydans sp.]